MRENRVSPNITPSLPSSRGMSTHTRDAWIPWYFVAFFVVLALLDGIFVYLATSTNPGVVTQKAYTKGKDYNEVIASSEDQTKRGWNADVSLEGTILSFTLVDKNGIPLSGAKVLARFRRPTEANQDFQVSLLSQGNGLYIADVKTPEAGLWDITFFASWNNKPYQMHQRIRVLP